MWWNSKCLQFFLIHFISPFLRSCFYVKEMAGFVQDTLLNTWIFYLHSLMFFFFWLFLEHHYCHLALLRLQQLQLCTQAPYMLVAIMVMVDGHPAIWRRGCRKIWLLRNLLLNSLSPSEQLDCSHGRHHLPSKEIFFWDWFCLRFTVNEFKRNSRR